MSSEKKYNLILNQFQFTKVPKQLMGLHLFSST